MKKANLYVVINVAQIFRIMRKSPRVATIHCTAKHNLFSCFHSMQWSLKTPRSVVMVAIYSYLICLVPNLPFPFISFDSFLGENGWICNCDNFIENLNNSNEKILIEYVKIVTRQSNVALRNDTFETDSNDFVFQIIRH